MDTSSSSIQPRTQQLRVSWLATCCVPCALRPVLFAGLDPWRLAAMEQLVSSSKSLVIAAALLRGRLSVADAVKAARLEEDFPLQDWGGPLYPHDAADEKRGVGLRGRSCVITKKSGISREYRW